MAAPAGAAVDLLEDLFGQTWPRLLARGDPTAPVVALGTCLLGRWPRYPGERRQVGLNVYVAPLLVISLAVTLSVLVRYGQCRDFTGERV